MGGGTAKLYNADSFSYGYPINTSTTTTISELAGKKIIGFAGVTTSNGANYNCFSFNENGEGNEHSIYYGTSWTPFVTAKVVFNGDNTFTIVRSGGGSTMPFQKMKFIYMD